MNNSFFDKGGKNEEGNTQFDISLLLVELVKSANSMQPVFLTIKDVVKMTPLSKDTVEYLFNDPDFPACDYGKQKFVSSTAFFEYFSTARRKEDSGYWRAKNNDRNKYKKH